MSGLGLATLVPLSASAADAVAGAQTAGDSLFPNQGNGGYDALHYDVNFAVDVAVSSTSNAVSSTTLPNATATITAATTAAPLSSYSFDFQGSSGDLAASTLNVDSVTVNGAPATFTRIENTTTTDVTTDVHKLVVTPATPVDGTFTTVVKYSGSPVVHIDADGSAEGWNNTTDGATFLNQPVGAMTLFPNNDTPRDKATYTFTVDAPSMLATSTVTHAGGRPYQAGVVSNGELVSRTPNADSSRTTWVWDEKKPMASELSMVSIGQYDIYSSNIALASGRTIPEWSFIDPSIALASQTTTLSTRAQLKALIDFYETKYGPYPGNSTGLVTDIVPSGINYALETQDRPFFPTSASRGTWSHEMMHQWFGDNVSPTDWNDITLNEGPATYAESQFPYEGSGSSTTTTESAIYALYNATYRDTTFTVAPAAMTDAADLFGGQVYDKGVMALEALRTSIGAANFETLMRQWQLQYGGTQVTGRRTAAFEALAESISGRDLSAFFTAWWYTAGKPAWPVKFNLNLAGPTTQVNPGDAITYTLTARNTGKVAMPAAGTVVTVNISDILDDAAIGALPTGVTLDGTTLTWTVPATALAATASAAIPFTVNSGTTGHTIAAVARASTLGSTCVDCAPSTVIGTAPISPAPVPTITGGTPTVAQTLTADTPGWADGTTFAYQWYIDGTPVAGATGSTFTPDGSVVGLTVSVKVTGTLAGFTTTSRTSAATAPGVRATAISATPTISGTPKIGVPLTVDPGTWQAGEVFTYQWRANGTNISGATGPVYTPAVASQVGQTIDVVVTGTKFGYTTTAKTSAASAAVAATSASFSSTPTAVLSTTAPKVGVQLSVSPGYWDEGTTLSYQWAVNGTNVTGSTGTGVTFTPTGAQANQTLTVVQTATKAGATAVTQTLTAGTIAAGTQVLQPTPTITGTPRAGAASTGVPGTWDSGTTRTYKWYADGVAIAGATAVTYTPTVDQIGATLTFEVTSTRTGYTTVVKSSDGKTVVGFAQSSTPTPTIDGTPKVASTLTVIPGTWDDGTVLTYQWSADGTAIDGATAQSFTATPAELGKAITVAVTSTKATYETVTKSSDPTVAVAAGDLAATPVPTIVGTPKVDIALTAVPGSWDDGTTLAYQWEAAGVPIAGATAATYVPSADDLGKTITLDVTGSRPGYVTVTKSSAATAVVAAGDLVATPVPTISGIAKVDVALAAASGTWDAGTQLAYQWYAAGAPIAGATGATFTPDAGQFGSPITVSVTGTKPGYAPVTVTSAPTGAVAAGDLVATPDPVVSGKVRVGQKLTARAGSWDAGVTLSLHWLRDGKPIAGATKSIYTPVASDLGHRLSLAVTGSKAGYTTVVSTGTSTKVAAGVQSRHPKTHLTGTAKVGRVLKVKAASFDPGVTLSYTWYADGHHVRGSAKTFTILKSYRGKRITVTVTATKPGYLTESSTSAKTARVK